MTLQIKNFGNIMDAQIRLDGITVICGNNNTGKSTVGKALFAYFNTLYDFKNKIATEKANAFIDSLQRSYANRLIDPTDFVNFQNVTAFIEYHQGTYTEEDVKRFIDDIFPIKLSKQTLSQLVNRLNTSESDVLNEYVYRYFGNVMNGQIKNMYLSQKSSCFVSGEFGGFTNTISFTLKNCTCEVAEAIEHMAYYINNPFSLDALNEPRMALRGSSLMSRSVIEAIQQAQAAINEDSMTNILDTVMNKKELDSVREILKKAYSGNTVIDHGMYYYTENDRQFDIRNISAGLKSFALIERLLETGALKRKDVLILDEPEIHLHTEWQIIYAELIVILQKAFDLTILLVTHSFQFLESLTFFMKKYGIADRGHYYMPIQDKKGVKILDSTDNLSNIKKNLKSGMYRLADMILDETIDGDSDEDNFE